MKWQVAGFRGCYDEVKTGKFLPIHKENSSGRKSDPLMLIMNAALQ